MVDYLETLAEACDPERLTVVVLDNAPFQKGEQIKARRAVWEAKGLYLRYLPAYCPQLNLIESVWRKLKSFLGVSRGRTDTESLAYAANLSKASGFKADRCVIP